MNRNLHRPCPACDSLNARQSGHKNGYEFFVCSTCESIFTGRLPVANEHEDYDLYYNESNLTAPEFVVARIGEIVNGFSRYRSTNRLLDVGFGAGTIMQVAEMASWEVCGTEISLPAVEHARSIGRRVHQGTLSSAGYPDHHFDVITASEILEHLPDPLAELKEIHRILRPGGLFWGTTPSARSLSFRLMKQKWSVLSPPEHTQLYSKFGARLMLAKVGFKNVQFHTFGLNPAEIIDYYRQGNKPVKEFDRVTTSYDLNEKLTRSRSRRLVKNALNTVLDIFQIGDSLKIFAVKNGSNGHS